MIYIGIDPGLKGSLAIIGGNTPVAFPFDKQTYLFELRSVRAYCDKFKDECICCIEQVHSMPKQGVTSSFNFGKNYGWILGALEANNIPYQEIPPQRWKKEFGLNSDKVRSIEVCKQLFPNVSLRKTARCTTDDDGMAEALMLALYAKRKL